MNLWGALLALNGLAAQAVQPAPAYVIPIEPSAWQMEGNVQIVENFGRRALSVERGSAIAKGVSFDTGVIEADLWVNGERGFPGVMFRGQDRGNFETFFIRPHLSGQPDASQYTPVVNGISGWQIFTGEGFTTPIEYRLNAWMHLRLDVYAHSALVSLDGKPVLHVRRLMQPMQSGWVGFHSVLGHALFSDLRITAIPNYLDPAPSKATDPLPVGTVRSWHVSEALAEADAMRRASSGEWRGILWTELQPENGPIVNLARATANWSAQRPTAIALFEVDVPTPAQRELRFGFSDRVTIFVNGRRIFEGDDRYRSRDYRFLGTVGLHDTLYLPLRSGRNEVAFVVTEGDGGGFAAAAVLKPTSE